MLVVGLLVVLLGRRGVLMWYCPLFLFFALFEDMSRWEWSRFQNLTDIWNVEGGCAVLVRGSVSYTKYEVSSWWHSQWYRGYGLVQSQLEIDGDEFMATVKEMSPETFLYAYWDETPYKWRCCNSCKQKEWEGNNQPRHHSISMYEISVHIETEACRVHQQRHRGQRGLKQGPQFIFRTGPFIEPYQKPNDCQCYIDSIWIVNFVIIPMGWHWMLSPYRYKS